MKRLTNGFSQRGLRLRSLTILLLAANLPALSGCAWLDMHEARLALRPTAGRPAGLAPDEQLFRPGDERWLAAVPAFAANAVRNAASNDTSNATSNATSHAARGAPPQQLALWWLPQPDPAAPALLYLHGTFRNLYQNLPKINALREAGFAVLAVDYRGWGDSTSIVPSEATITADAAQAWAELQRRQPLAARRVIYGHSMGGAVAVRLASTLKASRRADSTVDATSGAPAGARVGARVGVPVGVPVGAPVGAPVGDYAALVLESTFTRLPDVAAAAGFWGRSAAAATTLSFDSLSRIARVDAPILMLHGRADTTVPIALGRRLRDAAPPGVRWIEIEGGHHSRLHSQVPALYREALRSVVRFEAPRAADRDTDRTSNGREDGVKDSTEDGVENGVRDGTKRIPMAPGRTLSR
ncbi:MAG: alpha/beta hydrolase [Rubrivivax sp.]|nr:alpha/beta hydrolase [Rubrivivax sp.]